MISFEKLVARNVVVAISKELDLAGSKMTVNKFLGIAIVGGFLVLIILSYSLFFLKFHFGIAALAGVGGAILYEIVLYMLLEFNIEKRKSFVESILPDYLELVAANVRSGISLDKAMVLAARPEFKYFSDDVKLVNKQLYAGSTLQNALMNLANRYRSLQLKHTIRMLTEAIQYGGGMTDLLHQVAKDIRNQQIIQKEISGQLFMYTIFIAFAAIIGAPTLYALTTKMMTVTDTVWAGILAQNPGGLPTTGVSFLRPSPPKITISMYEDFALTAVILITGFGAFIVSAISTGSVIKGIRYLPIFILVGLGVFYIVGAVIGSMFASISGL
ncbi:MAG: type II secretion system F family protein [Candidatus Micrarchaeia archaeon]|jgi:flagellar protein FlaJ